MPRTRLLSLLAILLVVPASGCSKAKETPAGEPRQTVVSAAVPIISATEAKALIARGGVLVDVREPAELAETGKLEGALNVPLSTIKIGASSRRLPPELQRYTARPVLFYCASGRRSALAAGTLRQLGLRGVYNLGGFEDAVREGMPADPAKSSSS
jgi:rhodanese-related sulfurtransferase